MRASRWTRLSDRALLRKLVSLLTQDRVTLADLLAVIAEVERRRLYVPAGYSSMFAYCVHELHLSEDAAYRRLRAGRTAVKFPALFTAVAEGRLHLTAVLLLTPFLTEDNAEELLAGAEHKTKAEIELLLAQRFPKPDVPTRLRAVAPREHLAPAPVEAPAAGLALAPGATPTTGLALAPGAAPNARLALAPGAGPRHKVKPLAPRRFALQLTIDQSTHDKLRYAQSLLSHCVPSGDIAQVLDRALDALVAQLEKRKFAATERPRNGRHRKAAGKRTIPARVRRAVWERDRGRCTFVGENGHRCDAREFLEYDHVDPVARGGEATVNSMRLRCRAHNQHEAERAFGAGFMDGKREAARRERALAATTRVRQAAEVEQAPEAKPAAAAAQAAESDRDVMAALRTLGFRADESRRAVKFRESLASASLEERVRLALSYFRPRAHSRSPAMTSAAMVP